MKIILMSRKEFENYCKVVDATSSGSWDKYGRKFIKYMQQFSKSTGIRFIGSFTNVITDFSTKYEFELIDEKKYIEFRLKYL